MPVCSSANLNQQLEDKKKAISENIEWMKKRLDESDQGVDKSVLSRSVKELQQLLSEGKCTPLSLLRGFQKNALEIYSTGNSGICEFIKDADEQAQKLTDSWASLSAEDRSPITGIPISIKELCSVKGYDSTFGLLKQCNQPAKQDCVIVEVLREAGAIPFVLTATSPLAFTTNGKNAVFGRMLNPITKRHEAGGSSTGEAVLIAQQGSCVGIVTDIAGSTRIPGFFCGLYALKPTTDRVSSKGGAVLLEEGLIHYKVTIGVMGRRTDDLVQVMSALLRKSMFSRDPSIVPLPFNQELYAPRESKPLRIGYYTTFNHPSMIQTVPSIRRAIHEAVASLRANGHTLVEFQPPEPFQAFVMALQAFFVDGGKGALKVLAGEPMIPDLKFLKLMARLPDCLTGLGNFFSRKWYGEPSALAHTMKSLSGAQVVKLQQDIDRYCDNFFEAWRKAGPLDALICPPWAYPSYPCEVETSYVAPSMAYTVLYNLLDYPSGVAPLGEVVESDIGEPANEPDDFHKKVMEMQQDSVGLPLGVQIVAPRYQEELVLRLMRELEEGRP